MLRSFGLTTILVGASATLAGACILADIGMEGRPCPCAEGYSCDPATNTCVEGDVGQGGNPSTTTGSAPTTTTGTTSSANAGGGDGGSGVGGGGGPPVLPEAVPLVAVGDIQTGGVALSVNGVFRLEADAGHNWQIARWYDLENDPGTDLAGDSPPGYTDTLVDTLQVNDGINGWTASFSGPLQDIDLVDQTPARFGILTAIDYPLPGLRIRQDYWIYASGKVSVRMRAENAGGSPLSILDSEYHYTSVKQALVWESSGLDSGHSASFQRNNGTTLELINLSAEVPVLQDQSVENWNKYWQLGMFTLNGGAGIERYGAMLVTPGNLDAVDLAARSVDMRVPGLYTGQGAEPVGTGFDQNAATYELTATGEIVEFGVMADRARFRPTFVIRDFTSPQWTISQGSTTLVSNASLVGPGSVAWHDPATGVLVFVYLGDISESASDSERIFVLEAQ
ncbi:MAG: hypothetical protein HOV80_30905 [Polyangiaceae bacterium]|nr:hypothetical protein [Polyangiaceae bacterium]